MSLACVYIPKVVNRDGSKVDSKLFQDLLSFLPDKRSEVVDIYQRIKSPEFEDMASGILEYDSNGEPTLRSLINRTDLNTVITDKEILKSLNRRIGHYKKGTDSTLLLPKTEENLSNLVNKAIDFNNNSEYRDDYVATVATVVNPNTESPSLEINVSRRTSENTVEAENMEYNKNLNSRLRDILASKGVPVEALTELERRLGITGVTDFQLAKTAAEGIRTIIRLADGIKGEQVLPEEFAHFAIEALGSNNNLVNRLLNVISENNLASEILGEEYITYREVYKNDELKLAKEAAGKLVSEHLLNNKPIPVSPYKNLLTRLISFIKDFFKDISASSINKAIIQANKAAGNIATGILEGDLVDSMKVSNITETQVFYNLNERVERDKNLLKGIIENELKRYKIYESRNPNSTFSSTQQSFIQKLEESLRTNNTIDGIYTFVERALDTFRSLNTRLVNIQGSNSSLNEKARTLRDVRNYLYSYSKILDDIHTSLREEEQFVDNRYGDRVRIVVEQAQSLLNNLFKDYNRVGLPLFTQFIEPFLGKAVQNPFSRISNTDAISNKDIMKIAERDISFFDRWLDSMADSRDLRLNIFDQIVKNAKEKARLETIDISKELQAAAVELEQSGIKGFEWMFEDNHDKYISEIDYTKYNQAYNTMIQSLNDKYGANPTGNDARAYNREKANWLKENTTIIDGVRTPIQSKYANEKFSKLNDAQRKFYKTVMGIKERLDNLLPENYTSLLNTIKIRKDLVERLKGSDNVKEGIQELVENIKDQFIRRSDDTEFGDRATVEDFEGRQVQILPIYYTKLRKGEKPEDTSTDIVATLTAYAAMANDFAQMNKVIDVLELGRDLLRDNLDIRNTAGNKPLVERFNTLGRNVEKNVFKQKEDRRIIQRLDDFFDMQVYGRYMKDEGTFGETNIDKAKVANFINRMASLNTLALNVLSGISNVATGTVMMRIESIAKEFFSEKDTITADKIYAKEMPAFLAQLGDRVKTSKIFLWGELFNVMQEYETDVREVNFDRKTWFSQMFNTSSLFFMNNAGEHWMQFRTSLALANAYKMKAPDGKIVSLWDAMEVRYTDPNNKKRGARLVVKEGYTKEDGSEFTENDLIRFSRKSAAINQRMHGIYNKLDRNAFQKLAIGRMAMMFRKWMRPSFTRRWSKPSYNFDLDTWTEGYYNTAGRFIKQLGKELREGQFSLVANWKQLSNKEKANIKRALTEVAHFAAIAILLGLIEWPDDKNRPWVIKQAEYQLRRLYTEIGVMTPGPQLLQEGLRILKSPAAGVNTMEDLLDTLKILNPYNYEYFGGEDAVLKSGRYKGRNRATKFFFESPLVPMNRTVYRGLYPEESIPFFKQ